MPDSFYNDIIIKWAKTTTHQGTIENPDGKSTVSNPLCGDRVTIELTMKKGRIREIGCQVRGCILSKASCALFSSIAEGLGPREVKELHQEFKNALKSPGTCADKFPEPFKMFTPVKAHKSRHLCLLLVFEAVREAMKSR